MSSTAGSSLRNNRVCNNLLIHNVEVDRNQPSGVWIKIGVSVECNAIVNGYVFLELARAPPLAAAALVALDSQNRQLRILTRSNCIEVSQKAVIWHFILCIQYMRRMKQRRTTGCAYGARIRTAIADDICCLQSSSTRSIVSMAARGVVGVRAPVVARHAGFVSSSSSSSSSDDELTP